MAPNLRTLYLLLVCVTIVVNVEAKFFGNSLKTSTSKPARHTSNRSQEHESIPKPSKYTFEHATQRNSYSGAAAYPSGTQAPKAVTQRHAYPGSHGHSGVGSVTTTSASHVKQLYNPVLQAQVSKPLSQLPSYPASNGRSGNEFNAISSATQPPSYPSSHGKLSGAGSNPPIQAPVVQAPSYPSSHGKLTGAFNGTSQAPSYPSNNGILSGHGPSSQSNWGTGNGAQSRLPSPGSTGAHKYPTYGQLPGVQVPSGGVNASRQSSTSQMASYPSSNGSLSGSGRNQSVPQANWGSGHGNQPLLPSPGSTGVHTYPNSYGQSGSGHKPIKNPQTHSGTYGYPHTQAPPVYINPSHANTTYSDHIYVRNQHPTYIYKKNNLQLVHHYPYKPPSHIHYTSSGSQYHYPVYKEELPEYVYEYSLSKSRFSTLLAGLALYNLGHLSKDHAAHKYHNQYRPRPGEICRFGIEYDKLTREEVDIDCRLITEFIWSLQSVKRTAMVPNIKQILLPNGTLVRPESVQIDGFQVVDALDPRFNGAPVPIKQEMKCYMKYFDAYYVPTEKHVSCGVLQTYVKKSFNSARKITPVILVLAITVVFAMLN